MSLYYIKSRCKNYTFKVLVDSGAQMNVISPTMSKLLNLQLTQCKGRINGVGQANIIGSTKCTLYINKIPILLNFKVVNLNIDKYITILGLEFLNQYKCILNFKTKTLQFDKHMIRFMTNDEVNIYKCPNKATK